MNPILSTGVLIGVLCTAWTRRRSRSGSTCSSLASARSEVSSMPATPPLAAAVRNPTVTATASSSSSNSGGSEVPAPRR